MLKSLVSMSIEAIGSVSVLFLTNVNKLSIGVVGVEYKFVICIDVWEWHRSTVIDSKWFVVNVWMFCNMHVFAQQVKIP